jgi:hypothetical protein
MVSASAEYKHKRVPAIVPIAHRCSMTRVIPRPYIAHFSFDRIIVVRRRGGDSARLVRE